MLRVVSALAIALLIPFASIAQTASWYHEGKLTANGERFNPDGITCAHKHLAFHTKVRVTNLRNGRSVICRVNDRGPFIAGREIDLSRGAARQIGMLESGVAQVRIEVLN